MHTHFSYSLCSQSSYAFANMILVLFGCQLISLKTKFTHQWASLNFFCTYHWCRGPSHRSGRTHYRRPSSCRWDTSKYHCYSAASCWLHFARAMMMSRCWVKQLYWWSIGEKCATGTRKKWKITTCVKDAPERV